MMTLSDRGLELFAMSIFCLPHRERRKATFVHLYCYFRQMGEDRKLLLFSGSVGKICLECGPMFDPWVRKVPWRRE